MKLCKIIALFLAGAAAAVAQDANSSLIFRLPLNEASGATAVERVAGLNGTLVNAPGSPWINPGLHFSNAGQGVSTPAEAGNGVTDQLTLAAWVRLEATSGGATKGVIGKGRYPTDQQAYMLGTYLGKPFFKCNWSGVTGGSPTSGLQIAPTGIALNQWVHLAVTSNGTSLKFYTNGTLFYEVAQAITIGTATSSVWVGYDQYSWRGDIRDARIYSRALSAADVAFLAEGRSVFSTAYAGLWIGEATLNEVIQAGTTDYSAAPEFRERLIMHVDEDGVAQLCSEATVMRTRGAGPVHVVVTQPSLIANFDGITPRGGKDVGQRFSSAGFPVPGGLLALKDGGGGWLFANSTLAAGDPVNPFRHKYHPDLASGRELRRSIWTHSNPGDSPSDNVITTVVYEDIAGLHKNTLKARGPVTFTRVSTSGKLNQP